jgi:formamidopyrimidine-DNA glycosylase
MISHLGMTGQWLVEKKKDSPKKHDHLCFIFEKGSVLTYNDPRRFGYVDYLSDIKKLSEHSLFSHLGLEPFANEMDAQYLQSKAKNSNRAVKTFLMDQAVVVGVGNIYASEVLFKANVKPQRVVKKMKLDEWKKIAQSIKAILKKAIDKGGSTISDYRKSDGSEGSFQNYFFVYDRADEPCKICKTPISSSVIGGRATYWCSNCQS